ncbi:MAG: HD domain-containing phosphohydrolase [Thermoguttaceae bacterium]
MNVLVADDEPIARQATAHALTTGGYHVTTANDGREALDILARGEHRLVVSDWKMPRMDGVELCRIIRSGRFPQYIYCILLTNLCHLGETIVGLNAGADDYICKPFNPEELILRVNIGRRTIALETRHLTIFALAKLAESRDPETGEHLERVQEYSRALADHLRRTPAFSHQIDDEFVELIYQTSPLHDIGKVAIPDCVLLKPGRLTREEFEIMETHTTRGAMTIESVVKKFPGARFLEMARDIALAHHEKYDGRGYPRGLFGGNIPLSARIVAIADVYDALTSRRVYKKAYSHEDAKRMIISGSGKHFDPAIVEAFVAEEDVFLAIRDRHAEPAPAASQETIAGAPWKRFDSKPTLWASVTEVDK